MIMGLTFGSSALNAPPSTEVYIGAIICMTMYKCYFAITAATDPPYIPIVVSVDGGILLEKSESHYTLSTSLSFKKCFCIIYLPCSP